MPTRPPHRGKGYNQDIEVDFWNEPPLSLLSFISDISQRQGSIIQVSLDQCHNDEHLEITLSTPFPRVWTIRKNQEESIPDWFQSGRILTNSTLISHHSHSALNQYCLIFYCPSSQIPPALLNTVGVFIVFITTEMSLFNPVVIHRKKWYPAFSQALTLTSEHRLKREWKVYCLEWAAQASGLKLSGWRLCARRLPSPGTDSAQYYQQFCTRQIFKCAVLGQTRGFGTKGHSKGSRS